MNKANEQTRTAAGISEELTRLLLGSLNGKGQAGNAPALVGPLLRDALRERATDIHLDPRSGGMRVRLRIDGELRDAVLLTHDQALRLINQLKGLGRLDPGVAFAPLETRFTFAIDEHELDLRLSSAPCLGGEKVSIRLMDPRQMKRTLAEVGLGTEDHRTIEDWLHSVNGLFVVTGPASSGKSTTLYALLEELKVERRSIVTIEDPIEYQVDGITQIQLNERRDMTFARALKSVLRLDPDYVMQGEIRDGASAKAVIDASMTGRVVMSTMHSHDAVSVVSALRNWGLSDHEISAGLTLVIGQRLLRVLCRECRRQGPATAAQAAWLKSVGRHVAGKVWQAEGCAACRGTGYFERTGIFEVWRPDESDYAMILAGADEHALRAHVFAGERKSLGAQAIEKAEEGVTSVDEVRGLGVFAAGPGRKARRARRPVITIKAKEPAAVAPPGAGAGAAEGARGAMQVGS